MLLRRWLHESAENADRIGYVRPRVHQVAKATDDAPVQRCVDRSASELIQKKIYTETWSRSIASSRTEYKIPRWRSWILVWALWNIFIDSIVALFGSIDYVQLEALSRQEVSAASDMWSLGVILYILLSGYVGNPFSW
jgi:serine/threonine protein kinase